MTEPEVVSWLVGAAATIGVEALRRAPRGGWRAPVHDGLELLRMFKEVDDGSDEMAEFGRELARAVCEDVRARREPGMLALVGANHPFLLFFAVWTVAYLSLGGTVDEEHVLTIALLCCACSLLDIVGHIYQAIERRARR